MFNYKKIIQLKITFVFIFLSNISLADNHNISEVLELIQKDLKTLEKAVYSESVNTGNLSGQKSFDQNSEDVLTRHLLKLSDIENQFQELTNKFEEINFKLESYPIEYPKFKLIIKLDFKTLKMIYHQVRLIKN